MRKVTTVNLHNNAFQMDEEGYDALRRYLDAAAAALAANPDKAEILQDLEQAIADRCREKLGPHKSVVSVHEIEQILKDMGPVAGGSTDPAANTAGNTGATGTAPGSGGPGVRRLYRLRDEQKLTGVCAGLAAYAGLDVTWVRVAFILITVFSVGFGLVAYVALALVMPVAETAEQVAAAHGAPFSAQDVVDNVKKKWDEHRPRHQRRAERRQRREQARARMWTGPTAAVAPVPPGSGARIAGGLMLPVLTVLSAAWFCAMAIAGIAAWSVYENQALVGWAHGAAGHWHYVPRWLVLVALLVVYALIAMPIGAARRTALYYANGGRSHGWADAWSGMLWLALVAVMMVVAWMILPMLQDLLGQLLTHSQPVLHV